MQQDRMMDRAVCALNADIVGYSRLLADDFDATSEGMVIVRGIVERCIAERQGTLVNFIGDNFMAVFDTAIAGVQAAIEISSSLEQNGADAPAGGKIRFRMGMDRGSVSVSDGHYEGDALNVAARIQALARPGGLSVSGAVYRELDEPALRFRPTVAHRLKNIPEPVEVYEFVDLPRDGSSVDAGSGLALEIPTVAVLPIHTEGVEDTVVAAAALIRADIVHRLSLIPELVVVDAGDIEPGGAMGRAARYLLESGVHQFGERIRVYATVIDVTTMNVVKSHKISGMVDEVFDLSDRFSQEVGEAIEVELVVGATAGIYAELDDPVAIEKVYLGWYHLKSDTREGWERALSLFGEVAESHPKLPYGLVLSAFANWMGVANDWARDPQGALDAARSQARTGMDLGDPTGLAQTVDAAVLMSLGRIAEAVEAMGNVEIVRPTCDITFGLEGSLKRYLGEWEEAVDLMDVAMRLTGVNNPWYPTVKACSLFIGNRFEQAAAVAESVLEYQPNNAEALLVLAASQAEMGLDRRAHATADQFRAALPSFDVSAWLDRSPYQDPAMVARWRADLATLDLVKVD
jgi:adenylate cyclase